MFLKNYTSDAPVAQTVHRIEQVLIRCGVNGITKEYGPTGDVAAVTFHIKLQGQVPFGCQPIKTPHSTPFGSITWMVTS